MSGAINSGILIPVPVLAVLMAVLDAVREIADRNGTIEVNAVEQTIANIQYRYHSSIRAMYMISAILFIFGSISLMNMFLVDFQSRKCEFGLFEVVGTTKNQLSKLTSCSTCRRAGRMAIHAMKVEDFHSKLTSCSACRRAGRMAIHAVKVEYFHSKPSCPRCLAPP